MILISAINKPVAPSVAAGGLIGMAFSILTGQEILHYFALGFFASGNQGVAHGLSGEKPTMVQLNEDDDHERRVGFEWAHVVFFPTLLFNSCYDTAVYGQNLNAKTEKVQ